MAIILRDMMDSAYFQYIRETWWWYSRGTGKRQRGKCTVACCFRDLENTLLLLSIPTPSLGCDAFIVLDAWEFAEIALTK